MPLEMIAEVLTGLCRRFDADISLEGGEPFMRAGLGQMLADLDPDVLECITITTNGTVRLAAAPEVLKQLGGFRVSIDGHRDDLQRELRGVELLPVLRTCAKLREMGVPFIARMTLWKRNVELLTEIYEWASVNQLSRLSFFEYQPSGRGIGLDLLYGVSNSQITRLLWDLATVPPPQGTELVTVNLAERRVDDALAMREAFEQVGVVVKKLPDIANCTVNFDGSVGVSPWRVTAHGAPDVFTRVTEPGFLDVVEKAAERGALQDTNECLSRVQLRYEV